MGLKWEWSAVLAIAGYVLAIGLMLIGLYIDPFCTWYVGNAECSKRELFEFVYFICGGPLLFLVALFGLRQLRFARDSIRLTELATKQSKEIEAAKFSTEVARYFIDEVLETFRKADEDLTPLNTTPTQSFVSRGKHTIRWHRFKSASEVTGSVVAKSMLDRNQIVLNRLDLFAAMVRVYPEQEAQLFHLCSGAFFSCVAGTLPAIYLAKGKRNAINNLESLILRWEAAFAPSLIRTVLAHEKGPAYVDTPVLLQDYWDGHPDFKLR